MIISEKPLSSWVFERNRKLQSGLLVMVLATVFFRVLPLEMQKRIVNEAIPLRDLDALLLLCGLYIAAVVLAGGLKYAINVLQGYLGQKILYDMREQLYRHILMLPITFFRSTPPGMVIASLTSELAAVGDFLGGALVVPIINVLTLVTFAAYLAYLNPLLAALSFMIYPIEVMIIPRLQDRLNKLNQQRINVTRSISNIIGEAVSGIHEVHGNAGYNLEHRKLTGYASSLFALRHRMNIIRFLVKFINNFFQSLGPITLFLVGGYLTINGRLDLGALVAFLSAYEKLYDPWKELMDYYQEFQDSRVRYRQVMDAFNLKPEFVLAPDPERAPCPVAGHIEVNDLSFVIDSQTKLLDQVSLEVEPGKQLALVGMSGSGKSTLAMVIGQLYDYTAGHVLVDGRELKTLTKMDVSHSFGFVPQQPFIFDGSVMENITYGCRSLLEENPSEGDARLPGKEEVLGVVGQVGLSEDILKLGMNAVLDLARHVAFAQRVIEIRKAFFLAKGDELADVVDFFHVGRFQHYSTISENITFGYPNRPEYGEESLHENGLFRKFLRDTGLMMPLLELGRDVAAQTVSLLGALKDEAFFFESSPIPLDEFELYSEMMGRTAKTRTDHLSSRDRKALIKLALRFIPERHKMVALPPHLETRILEARPRFMDRLAEEDPGAFTFYRPTEYLYTRSVLDNILFGHPRAEYPHAGETVRRSVMELVKREGLLEEVMAIGLEFAVGSKGDRLSGGQKQKIALARALLKKPRVLILDEATASLDNTSQALIQQLIDSELKGRLTLIAVAHRLEMVKNYDYIAVMKSGRIVEIGAYEELLARKGALHELVHGS